MPGSISAAFPFWRDVLLHDHPEKQKILSWVREGMSLHEILSSGARGPSTEQPFNPEVFPGETLPNRVPEDMREFVNTEVGALLARGCLVPYSDVHTPTSPECPRLTMPLTVERSKPWIIYDARSLSEYCRHMPFSLESVGTVAALGWQGCFQSSLDDKSGSIMCCCTRIRDLCLDFNGKM